MSSRVCPVTGFGGWDCRRHANKMPTVAGIGPLGQFSMCSAILSILAGADCGYTVRRDGSYAMIDVRQHLVAQGRPAPKRMNDTKRRGPYHRASGITAKAKPPLV